MSKLHNCDFTIDGRIIFSIFALWCAVGASISGAQSTTFIEHLILRGDFWIPDALVTDVDADGAQDIVVIRTSEPAWFRNVDGKGQFDLSRPIGDELGPVRFQAIGGMLIAVDLDGDDNRDIFAAGLFNENLDGIGGFAPPELLFEGLGEMADFDLDGDQDVLVYRYEIGLGAVGWYDNTNGTLAFSEFKLISDQVTSTERVRAADLDGDGYPDAMSVSKNDNKVAWYRNLIGDGGSGFGLQRVIIASARGATDIVAADLDGDLDLDVVVAFQFSQTIAWFENLDGKGTFSEQRNVSESSSTPRQVRVADLDMDGDMDIIAGLRYAEQIVWFENLDHKGTFGPAHIIGVGENSTTTVFVADLDGDTDPDIGGSFATNGGLNQSTIFWFENQHIKRTAIEGGPEFSSPGLAIENYPNPFTDQTTVSLVLDRPENVSIQVYDVLGRELETPVQAFLPSGQHEFVLDSGRLPTGVLFLRVQANGRTSTHRMIHLD